MKTLNERINVQTVYELLKGANWDYEHCGDRINEESMQEYISDIDDNISLPAVIAAVETYNEEITATFDGEGEIERWAAVFIADSVAQALVDCIYQTVTFKANL